MRAAVISLGSVSSKWVVESLKKHFKEVDDLDIQKLEVSLGGKTAEIYYDDELLKPYDCIYIRGSFRYSNLLRAATTLLHRTAYMPLRPSAFTICHSKLITHLKLQEANISQPKTYLASTAEAGKKILQKMSFPVVMKLPSGTHGKGVMLAESPESASSMIDAVSLLRVPFLIQEYIETEGKDIRAIVTGDRVCAAMKRIAIKGEKRANIHAGAKGEKVDIDPKTERVAVAAAKACGCDVCAVDILPSPRGPMVIEINLSPGFQGITKFTKTNVSDIIAGFLCNKTKEFKEAAKVKVIKEVAPEREIYAMLDFRGNRILLPEIVTKATEISEEDEVILKVAKGEVEIKKTGKKVEREHEKE